MSVDGVRSVKAQMMMMMMLLLMMACFETAAINDAQKASQNHRQNVSISII